jgi:hypothetical protein
MTGQRFVHRVHRYDLECPEAGPRFLWAALFIGYGLVSAAIATIGLSGHTPGWMGADPVSTGLRIVLLALGAIHALHGTILTAEQIQHGWAVLGQRAGAFPVIETAGPCRLIQSGSHWDLHLALTDARLWSELDEDRERSGLYFQLDEADVAQIARIFDPGEEVAVRWVDLPMGIGGPTLLGVRTAAREEQVVPIPETGTEPNGLAHAA